MMTATKIAKALAKSRPVQLYTDHAARRQWYADVSALAEALRDDSKHFDSVEFFNICGVPS